jgi:hypothetical protein
VAGYGQLLLAANPEILHKEQFITGAVRKDLQGLLSAQSLFWDAEISCQDHMMISRGHY